jgi:hypothetical protein
MKYNNIREEALKNKVAADWFADFDTTEILGNIDFTIFPKKDNIFGKMPLLWAEAKIGDFDVAAMFVQLILTIGKARTFDKTLPPAFLGAFDFKKMAFVPYSSVQDIFYMNDFNWNVTPSNHETKEFRLIKNRIEATLQTDTFVYDYEKDVKELHFFIANNIAKATDANKIKIDKNNFVPIYLRWLQTIKPTLDVNWEYLKQFNIVDSDFYLADLFVDDKDTQTMDDDTTIRDNLFVIFQRQYYKIPKKHLNTIFDASIEITDKETYQNFWKRYKRPPISDFQDYILERRDLLVPQDIRERKGAFFTPFQWVELSQQYLAATLGENWQDEYYIWDCAAGTGNLLAGLTNKYKIWASTIDQPDVQVMHERIAHGANLLEKHCFQFDFLNDDFTKLPPDLQVIINNPEKCKKLVIYINPPYAEASDKKTLTKKEGKSGVEQSLTNKKYAHLLGQANAELFAQFFIRINKEIPNCVLANFSKLKIIQGQHFINFRKNFNAKLETLFLVPADTFDNVKGQFPIGFFVWINGQPESFKKITADVYDKTGKKIQTKTIEAHTDNQYINDWVKPYRADVSKNQLIGKFPFKGNDFQNQNMIQIVHHKMEYNTEAGQFFINQKNVLTACVYFAVRKVIAATWLNDRDQYLYPNDGWQMDTEFKNDCLIYTIFNNNIQSKYGANHWIPFTEYEVDAKEKFESDFMSKYIAGKIDTEITFDLFHKLEKTQPVAPLLFSPEATAVFEAGRALWTHYHAQKFSSFIKPNIYNANASFYDIREHFQGRNAQGRMNTKSTDAAYVKLIDVLRKKIDILAQKITPKVYEYGFLKT